MSGWLLSGSDLVAGLALAASGLSVLTRTRRHPVGLLLLASSGAWFLGYLSPVLVFLHRGPLIHLQLSYPTGRLHRRTVWVAVAAGYAWALVAGWTRQPAGTAIVAALVAVSAVAAYLNATGPARHAGRPALAASLIFASILALSAANQLIGLQADLTVALVYDAGVATIAVWLAADFRHAGWTQATLADLVTQLGGREDATLLVTDLRRALGDPHLAVGYWDGVQYIDDSGRVITAGHDQVTTEVTMDGQQVGRLFHDESLRSDPALLQGAVSVVRLAVSNYRLRSEIRDRATRVRDARRRTVEGADAQRRRLQADLARGPLLSLDRARDDISRLSRRFRTVIAPSTSGTPDEPDRLRDDLDELLRDVDQARGDLVRFSWGLRPLALEQGGLAAAISELTAHTGLPVHTKVTVGRMPPAVEAAVYFVCAETLTNAVKHAHADVAALTICPCEGGVTTVISDNGVGGADRGGAGLQGLVDRTEALGGTLTIQTGREQGTVVTARIPLNGGS